MNSSPRRSRAVILKGIPRTRRDLSQRVMFSSDSGYLGKLVLSPFSSSRSLWWLTVKKIYSWKHRTDIPQALHGQTDYSDNETFREGRKTSPRTVKLLRSALATFWFPLRALCAELVKLKSTFGFMPMRVSTKRCPWMQEEERRWMPSSRKPKWTESMTFR